MKCVYRATSLEQADIVIAWLSEQGIEAFVKDRNMAGGYAPWAVAPRGIEVCVVDEAQAVTAESHLAEHQKTLEVRHESTPSKLLATPCGTCGRLLEFPGELNRTVQACPYCGSTVDVGDDQRLC